MIRKSFSSFFNHFVSFYPTVEKIKVTETPKKFSTYLGSDLILKSIEGHTQLQGGL